jgi:PadR family transcriptional regulator, regulatory protein PadR
MLSFLILFLLSKGQKSGKELTDEIAARKGDKPSPGTLYPALKNLREEKMIQEKKQGKNSLYTLTATGKEALKEAKTFFCRTFKDVM